MILCASCNTWQHATCFAILKPEEAPEIHYCVQCAQVRFLIGESVSCYIYSTLSEELFAEFNSRLSNILQSFLCKKVTFQ